ncbi:hypothetical protein Bca4012_029905 [Brassica carinata]
MGLRFGIYEVEDKEDGTIRKNILTPHYRQMFGEPGSHLDPSSSSAPGSSLALGSSGLGLTNVLHRT